MRIGIFEIRLRNSNISRTDNPGTAGRGVYLKSKNLRFLADNIRRVKVPFRIGRPFPFGILRHKAGLGKNQPDLALAPHTLDPGL